MQHSFTFPFLAQMKQMQKKQWIIMALVVLTMTVGIIATYFGTKASVDSANSQVQKSIDDNAIT